MTTKKIIEELISEPLPDYYVSTGSFMLDLALSWRASKGEGGLPLGRVSHIYGDYSTGKTLIAMEALASFIIRYGDEGLARYGDFEHAFMPEYVTESLGIPLDRLTFANDKEGYPLTTIEEVFEDLSTFCEIVRKDYKAGFYVMDSLDSLSSEAEQKRDIDKGSFALEKQKKLSELFRRLKGPLNKSQVHLMCISQIRDNVSTFSFKTAKPTSGKALGFYATHRIELNKVEDIVRQVHGTKLPTGVWIKATVDKNKVSNPKRKVLFPILFDYGIDNIHSMASFLKESATVPLDLKIGGKTLIFNLAQIMKRVREEGYDSEFARELDRQLRQLVIRTWHDIEQSLEVKGKGTKYKLT